MEPKEDLGPVQDEGPLANWCLSEFQSESIGLEHERPQDFVTSQWSSKPKVYVLYRLIMAVVLLGWVGGDIAYETGEFFHDKPLRWLGFATNWSFAILCLCAIYQAITTTLYLVKPYWIMDPVYIRAMPVVLKVQWFLFNVSSNSALVVTAAYWGFIAFVADAPFLTSHMSRLKHTANSIYVIADVMIGATPIRIYHVFFTVFLGSVYTVFNAIYFINFGSLMVRQPGVDLDGRDYYFMNWSQPVEAICTCVLAIVMTLVAQVFLHLLSLFRSWLHRRLVPQSPSGDSELQQIIGNSHSYDSLHESYGEKVASH